MRRGMPVGIRTEMGRWEEEGGMKEENEKHYTIEMLRLELY